MRGSYNFTRAGLRNAGQYGITPRELWEVIGSTSRVFVPVGDRSRFVVGRTLAGRWLGFLAQESEHEADVWDVVAARELDEQEITNARRVRGDRDA